jgi:RNA polymerase sigma-70 factor (ECF subfamily)
VISFHQLYETYSADVYRFAFWLCGDRFEAEDLTSETFIRAWVKQDSIRTETLIAYLLTITRNLYLETLRKIPQEISLQDVYPDPNPDPEQVVAMQSAVTSVHIFLQTLPEIDRAAFVLRVQHELPYAEIARSLDISIAAAKVKVHRIRKKLILNQIKSEEATK